jgi:endonuclease YncB( thermonuclease family)
MGRVAIWVGLLLSGAALAGVIIITASNINNAGAGRQIPDGNAGTASSARTSDKTLPAQAGSNLQTPPLPGGLAREPARAPLSVLAAPQPPAPPPTADELPKKWRLVHGTVASAAGMLEADGMTFVLPGIDIVSSDEMCPRPGEGSWPCGMAARTAFRAYLRGRALNCRIPDARIEEAVLTECLLQGEDPARWLVMRGWARAKEDGPFVVEGETARSTGQGIFGPAVN